MEDRNVLDVFCGWTEGERRDSGESWVLLVKEELPDEIIKIDLTDVFPQCLE